MQLIDFHEDFKESKLLKRRFKHKDIQPLITECGFDNKEVGKSYEGRNIRKIVAGTGKRKILLWSQMHGDEATATMAIFDILNFLRSSDSKFVEFRNAILSELELHFVPMINPDGAERFQRRTAQEIDMNRDAAALQCVESRLLKSLVLDLQPEFSFNLHDQAIYYAAGEKPKQAAVAFLATAYDKETSWNEVRTKSMQVICKMNEELQQIIPGRVGRFSDEFEPRAFGDNIQKWGSSLILVESGSYPDDTEKQYVRALNFHAILHGLYTIATQSYSSYSLNDYLAIPQNNRIFLDLKITNAVLQGSGGDYNVDLGILITEKNTDDATDYVLDSVIEEMGDLSVFYGISNLDANGAVLKSITEFPELIEEHKLSDVPLNFKLGEKATFVLDHETNRTVVINGKVI